MDFEKIKKLCIEQGLTIPELSEKIGMSRAGLYTTIKNKTISVTTLEKIAASLNVSVSTFFFLDDLFPLEPSFTKMQNEINTLNRRIKEIEEQSAERKRLIELANSHIMNFADSYYSRVGKITDEKLKDELTGLMDKFLSDLSIEAYQKGLKKK